jgi:DNA-binding MarR family transcriptional regulator
MNQYPMGKNQLAILDFIKEQPDSAYVVAISAKLDLEVGVVSLAIKRLMTRKLIRKDEIRVGQGIRKYYVPIFN